MTAPDADVALVEGPWTHREVSANGIRFHVAEAGTGPLVLLLHGFPQFWWCWRDQIVGLAEAGYRVVAPDLRGYGGTDKPPRGYDGWTLTADVAGLVRALGERDAVLAGHDWGGLIAWSVAALHPQVVRRLVVLSAPHPSRLRTALLNDPRGQLKASGWALPAQLPGSLERTLLRDDAAGVAALLRDWSADGWPDPATERRYRDVAQVPQALSSALEYHRWAVRSLIRPSGYRFSKALQRPVEAPTLQLHGALDRFLLPRTAQGSSRYVRADYEWRLLDGMGHFLPEEAPDLVTGELLRWSKG